MLRHIVSFFYQFLKNDYLRLILVYFRYIFFNIFYKFKEIDSPYSKLNTNNHNKSAFQNLKTDCMYNRIKFIQGALQSLEYVRNDFKILLIGSRTENEFFYLKSFGFKNITCIDILSYSPKIECMDMHNLKFKSNKFDLIICGWVLIYSQNLKQCVREITRVAKNNSIISIGYAKDRIKQKNNLNTASAILKLFFKNIKKKIFIYDGELGNLSKQKIFNITGADSSNIITIFSIKK